MRYADKPAESLCAANGSSQRRTIGRRVMRARRPGHAIRCRDAGRRDLYIAVHSDFQSAWWSVRAQEWISTWRWAWAGC